MGRKPSAPRREPCLPGSRPPGVPTGMFQYVVNLVSPGSPVHAMRSAVVSSATKVAEQFIRRAEKAVADRGLAAEVGGFGEAYGLPVVTMTATPAVAALLEQLPGVEAVYRDDAGLGLIG